MNPPISDKFGRFIVTSEGPPHFISIQQYFAPTGDPQIWLPRLALTAIWRYDEATCFLGVDLPSRRAGSFILKSLLSTRKILVKKATIIVQLK